MTTVSPTGKSLLNGIRIALAIGGVISLIVGILILVWPGRSAEVVVFIIAIYAVASGLVYAGLGLFSGGLSGWGRIGHLVLGIIFVVAGIFAFVNLPAATAWFGAFIGIVVGIVWIVEGVVSLTNLGAAASRGWTIFYAIVTLFAGIFVLFSPLYGAAVLWLFLGILFVVIGIVQIVRAVTFKVEAV